MIYYEALSSDKQKEALHALSERRKVTKKMNVVCENDHLALRNVDAVPEEIWCGFCQKTYAKAKEFTQFYGPGPRRLRKLVEDVL